MATQSSILPGEFHGQRSLEGYNPCGHKESYTTEWLTHIYTGTLSLTETAPHVFHRSFHHFSFPSMMYGSSESSISSQMLIMYLKIAILVCVWGGWLVVLECYFIMVFLCILILDNVTHIFKCGHLCNNLIEISIHILFSILSHLSFCGNIRFLKIFS